MCTLTLTHAESHSILDRPIPFQRADQQWSHFWLAQPLVLKSQGIFLCGQLATRPVCCWFCSFFFSFTPSQFFEILKLMESSQAQAGILEDNYKQKWIKKTHLIPFWSVTLQKVAWSCTEAQNDVSRQLKKKFSFTTQSSCLFPFDILGRDQTTNVWLCDWDLKLNCGSIQTTEIYQT